MTTAVRPAQVARPERLRALADAVARRVSRVRAHPLLNPLAAAEILREARGPYPVESTDVPHLRSAVDWLTRAQDVTRDGGIARGYSLGWHAHFALRGWEPDYPETTGYIIPTLYTAAIALGRPELAERAEHAAQWEIALQLPSGGVRGGTVAQRPAPVVFNTGQVLLGWLAAFQHTGDGAYADAATRASRFLVSVLDSDGIWRRSNSPFADTRTTLYNARTAWALAEAGVRLGRPEFVDAGARALHAAGAQQLANGWLPSCCLTDSERPLLHTIAYALGGLVEGARVLEDDVLLERGARAASRIAEHARGDGRLPGRFARDWTAAAPWSCLTGNAQMVLVWLRLHESTGDSAWLEPVGPVMTFLKSTQNRSATDDGLRGGIKGAYPVTGEYGRLEVLSWATKFFADALMRTIQVRAGSPPYEVASLA